MRTHDSRTMAEDESSDTGADSNGMGFSAFVMMTYGGWHSTGLTVLRELTAAV